MQTLIYDLRYAIRQLRKNPGFTAVAVITLALGIGANTAIFSVVQHVLLAPMPFPQPDRLVAVSESTPQRASTKIAVSGPDFVDFHDPEQIVFAHRRDGSNVHLYLDWSWRAEGGELHGRHGGLFPDVGG